MNFGDLKILKVQTQSIFGEKISPPSITSTTTKPGFRGPVVSKSSVCVTHRGNSSFLAGEPNKNADKKYYPPENEHGWQWKITMFHSRHIFNWLVGFLLSC